MIRSDLAFCCLNTWIWEPGSDQNLQSVVRGTDPGSWAVMRSDDTKTSKDLRRFIMTHQGTWSDQPCVCILWGEVGYWDWDNLKISRDPVLLLLLWYCARGWRHLVTKWGHHIATPIALSHCLCVNKRAKCDCKNVRRSADYKTLDWLVSRWLSSSAGPDHCSGYKGCYVKTFC